MAVPASDPTVDAQVAAVLPGLAAAAIGRAAEFTEFATAEIVAAEPQLGADDAIADDLRRSVRANVERALGLLVRPAEPLPGPPSPPEAIAFATSTLRRGVEPSALIQAYRVGQNAVWRRWMDDVAAQVEDPELLIAILDLSSARLFGYVDAVIAQLLRHYHDERERWLGGALARRAEVVRAILDGGGDDPAEASRALGFELDRQLLALVLWRTDEPPPGGPALEGLQRLAGRIADAVGSGRALTVPAGSATLWAWVAAEGPAAAAAVQAAQAHRGPAEAVAFGGPAPGLAGMRQAHLEALEARRVAHLSGAGGVTCHAEVEVAALVSADLERLRGYVGRTLGPLAADDAAAARLRESLGAWFGAGCNARAAAERLGTHKNTVLYRVRRAEALLGHPLAERALEVQVALEAAARLGPAVLPPGG